MTYTLILFMSISFVSDKDSMALTNVPGFASQQECQAAGQAAVQMFAKGTKQGAFVCVAQKKA